MLLQYTLKKLTLYQKNQLPEKDKRSSVKSDKPTFTDQTCLDKSLDIVVHILNMKI